MSSGFSIGLNALQTNSGAIEVASKNIAASNVVGFKSSEFLFQEALSRSMQPAQGGRFAPTGTGGLTRRDYASGSTRYSSSPLDMSINGDGMFTLALTKDNITVDTSYFTRNGQFLTDKNGLLVNSSGLYLVGYQPNKNLDAVTDELGIMKEPPSPMAARATTFAGLAVNLDARKEVISREVELDNQYPDTFSHVTQLSVYDTVGKQHTVSMYFQKTSSREFDVFVNVDGQTFAANPVDGTATVRVTMPNSDTVFPVTPPVPVARFTFNKGILVNIGSPATEYVSASTGNLKLSFALTPPDKDKPFDPSLVLDDPSNFEVDFNGTTSFASSFEVKSANQDGYGAGSLSGLTVDDTGTVRGQFTNGKTVVAGQLLLATFRGLGGLKEVSANIYQATDQSGVALVGTGSSSIFGQVRSNSLEEANTDMAQELVRLMVQQRNYQANAQSIRAQMETLTTTIDVTR
ncbi:MAG: flagellar hook-basal body complex protein [Betaproteobacteria bacterium]|nr:flagellar hook-basal body complex protein [Betaproteobacteria bacterium]NDE53003.1 flagellar hook-basal body complex protein [Actinomycetota bacterium]